MHRQSMWDNKNLEQAVQIVRRGDAPFRNESDLLETTRVLFELRSQIRNSYDPDEVVDAPALEKKLRNVLHARLALTNASFPLVKRLKERRYSRLEIEVVLLLVISSLGMFE
ncbi:MAG: hypothetical protein QGF00_30085, partial [Planctomycetota bacterium]|nr:hypothetical protein [Planctomycetota bacterium]